MLLSILLLMVKLLLKYLIGEQGMMPVPAPKSNVLVSGKKDKETGNHSFHLFTHTFDLGVHSYGVHFQFQLETHSTNLVEF